MKNTFVIAEAGVNHNGSLDLAYQLVDVAVKAGADAVKFQTFIAEKGLIGNAEKAEYQRQTTNPEETQLDMIKKLELSFKDFKKLQEYCNLKGIEFMSTGCDLESLDFLINELNVKTLKISSGEIVNAPLLLKSAQSGKKIILSTGMSSLEDISIATAILEYGYTYPNKVPNNLQEMIDEFLETSKPYVMKNVTILHCTTEYPAPLEDLNLRAIPTIAKTYKTNVGYSDHSAGIDASLIAVTLGAMVIEKHFTLDKNMEGPDHKASLNPEELEQLIRKIHLIEKMLGNSDKIVVFSEEKNREIARKSLVAECTLSKGEIITEDKISIKRPGTGMSPLYYYDLLNKQSNKNYHRNDFFEEI